MNGLPPHTLGLVSLSVQETGDHALFNTLEGVTKLWNFSDNSIVGSHESFSKASGKSKQEPGVFNSLSLNVPDTHRFLVHKFGPFLYILIHRHMLQRVLTVV